MNLSEYGVFEWNVLISNIFHLVVVIFMGVMSILLWRLAKAGNVIAGHLSKAIGFLLLGLTVAPALGVAIGGWIHGSNIFSYAHIYITIPSISLGLFGVFWFYKVYVALKRLA